MFTGLIEEIGTVSDVIRGANSSRVTIKADVVLSDLKLGDSVATNGVCLTVTSLIRDGFTADIMHETLKSSSLSGLSSGTKVNLERAMMAGGRFGGHMVQGHVDGIGTIWNVEGDDNAVIYTIGTESDLLKYIIKKGSITIDGISLTIAAVDNQSFSVSIIPHTMQETTLPHKKKGDVVNLEVDMIAKYIEKMLRADPAEPKSKVTKEFLLENGF